MAIPRWLTEFRQAFNDQSVVMTVCGNIQDILVLNNKLRFDGFQEMVLDMARNAKDQPAVIRYDLFAGAEVLVGNQDEILRLAGLAEDNGATGNGLNEADRETVNMLQALKKANQTSDSPFPIDPAEIMPIFDRLMRQNRRRIILLFDEADAIFPAGENVRPIEKANGIGLIRWARMPAARQAGHKVFLVSRELQRLDERIRDRGYGVNHIRIPKPDEETRQRFLRTGLGEANLEEESARQLGRASAGLALRQLAKLAGDRQAMAGGAAALDRIFDLKKKILRDEYGDLMEILKPKHGFEIIAGLDGIKAKLQEVAAWMRSGQLALVPQGILFMGPPGTGKTLLAEAMAKDAGVNFVRPLDVKSMWLGQSEQRMTRLLNGLKDMAPVVVFIDEFDQNQGQRGGFDGDSGTSRSLFKKMLEVMSEPDLRGKVLWVMATNRPDLIDTAMKRAGRCDLRIPFLPPDQVRLEAICKVAHLQFPEMKVEVDDWKPFVEKCQDYNGADMVEVVRRAWERANSQGRGVVTPPDVAWAVGDYRPQLADMDQQALMTLAAIDECSSKSMLPPGWEAVRKLCAEYLKKKGVRA